MKLDMRNGLDPQAVSPAESETVTAEEALRSAVEPQKAIGKAEVRKAAETLKKYKDGKANFEKRMIEDELWYELRHWEAIRGKKGADGCTPQPEPVSAWLFNAIMNKHADMMDNMPEPVVLPQERSDEQSADILSSVMPVILDAAHYEQTYNDECWEKLKHGNALYGVFWDQTKENGLGDHEIRGIDLLKFFWEPGIEDLQDSHNVFLVDLVDNDDLHAQYPQLKGKLTGSTIDVSKYLYDDTVDTSNKSVVVDWYYKRRTETGRTILHYAKFVGDELLFASENYPKYAERGWYWHGQYPFKPDVLFPEKGSPFGFGYVSLCKSPQVYIDKLYANILETSLKGTKRRYFVSDGLDANEAEMLDENAPFVHVTGQVNDDRLKEMVTRPLDGIYLSVIQMKTDELKETAANRDISNGGSAGGATAAAAIAALQEAGNKVSRDINSNSYRAQVDIYKMLIENSRQFYDVSRTFRITNEKPYEYAELGANMLGDQVTGVDNEGNPLIRRPVFDVRIKAQKRNPFSRAEQNERAKELYGMGFFNPERAQEATMCLDMMDFEGIDAIKSRIAEGQTLLNVVQQQQQLIAQLTAILGGQQPGAAPMQPGGMPATQRSAGGGGRSISSTDADAQRPQTPLMQRMAKNAVPDMSNVSAGAMPGGR